MSNASQSMPDRQVKVLIRKGEFQIHGLKKDGRYRRDFVCPNLQSVALILTRYFKYGDVETRAALTALTERARKNYARQVALREAAKEAV